MNKHLFKNKLTYLIMHHIYTIIHFYIIYVHHPNLNLPVISSFTHGQQLYIKCVHFFLKNNS